MTLVGFLPNYPWTDNVFWPVVFGGSWLDKNGKVTPNKIENVNAISYQSRFIQKLGSDAIDEIQNQYGKKGTAS
ncbi:hypothetical protein [Paenibacillus sp. LjRoot153]|uniref:hypothetical protein n=1 Tax=Paenibacillus sp. LjRoot153 TaxID=3342270 RepID=UPI003F50748E